MTIVLDQRDKKRMMNKAAKAKMLQRLKLEQETQTTHSTTVLE